ncbi:MAG TPA: hypothetical protein VNW73_00345 [Ktedonobacteraceae bacterium]|jgi:hypothetical protein|nr:hypothetical protein [Ktedonobacteraceae bacterium]
MASKFTDFLFKLGEDPELLERFKQDPDTVMDEVELTPAEKTLLMSGNVQLIRSAIVNDPGYKDAMGILPEQDIPARMPLIVHGFIIPDSSKS